MAKKSKKNVDAERIKDLECQVAVLTDSLEKFMAFVGYDGKPYQTLFNNPTIKTVNINISK